MSLKVVGQNIVRVDGLSKVMGKAVYPQDIYMDGMLYGVTVRSERPHALIKIDTKKAETAEGVVKILTFRDIPGAKTHGVVIKDQEVFCSDRVKRIGDPLAFVIAVSEKAARAAASAVEIEYEDLVAVFNPLRAMEEDAPKIHGESNIVYHYKLRRGDIEEGFKNCDIIVENEYRTNMVDHAFLQPEAGVSYVDEDGTVTVCASTQYPHFDQQEIAEALDIPMEKVKIINPAVGGAFGGREDITLQIHLALGALLTGRPVKTVYSREESFAAHSKRHSMIMHYKTGANRQGKLLAMEAKIVGDTGAYASWAINVLRKSGVHATGPYVIPNVKVDSYAVYTNNPFAGAMRGFGATQVPIAYEQQMDALAEKLDMDPVSFRLINAFNVGDKTATGQTLYESVPLKKCIQEVAEKMGMSKDGGAL